MEFRCEYRYLQPEYRYSWVQYRYSVDEYRYSNSLSIFWRKRTKGVLDGGRVPVLNTWVSVLTRRVPVLVGWVSVLVAYALRKLEMANFRQKTSVPVLIWRVSVLTSPVPVLAIRVSVLALNFDKFAPFDFSGYPSRVISRFKDWSRVMVDYSNLC